MRAVILATAVLVLVSGTAWAWEQEVYPTWSVRVPRTRTNAVLFHDDMESGAPGWTTIDGPYGYGGDPHFHVDTYLAYPDPGQHPDYSWWCGLWCDASGGYGGGSLWDDRLSLPEGISIGSDTVILTFRCRHDMSTTSTADEVVVEGKYGGSWVTLSRQGTGELAEFTGTSGGWLDYTASGWVLTGYDSPLEVRFRLISDSTGNDVRGDYDSDGGAFMIDDIRVVEGSSELFFDDCEGGTGLCVASNGFTSDYVPVGDYWHIIDRACPAYSDPHCWWCGDDADTSVVPGSLINCLRTPIIDISDAVTCTLRFMLHAEVPTTDNDLWSEFANIDGLGWIITGAFWGDFWACDGWSTHGIRGQSVTTLLPASTLQFMWVMSTTENGCGPGVAGGAGIMIDDTWVEGEVAASVGEEVPTTWGRIKSMFR